jgi:dihydrolipoamide dehydrogenase
VPRSSAFNTACIDEWKNDKGGPAPGGTCTNIGCIPSKALLQSSSISSTPATFADHGIGLENLAIDVPQMHARKSTVVKQNNDGIVYLFKKNKVTFFHGRASFAKARAAATTLEVAGDKPDELTAKQVIIATGSNARVRSRARPFDEINMLVKRRRATYSAVPKTLGVIGSGVIGLEMGSVWRRLGADVTMLEALPAFLGAVDEQIAKEAHKALTKQGLKIELGVKITEVKSDKKGVVVSTPTAGAEQNLASKS